MKLPAPAKDVLRTAERQLVTLAHEASTNRDYEGATTLLDAARRVKCLADGEPSLEPAPVSSGGELHDSAPSHEKPHPPAVPAGVRVRKSDYPKFLRDGDYLIKVGWSKSDKTEYEHKSPKKVLLALGQTLLNAGAKGRRFSMDKVLPITDPADASQLPDYQCYLSLAWLRQQGLVIQHGRQGYSLPKKDDLLVSIESLWDQLPTRS